MMEQLHFLRPEWFYALIPMAMLLYLGQRHQRSSISWKKICDAPLLPHILIGRPVETSNKPLILTAIAGLLCITAAAGPVWKKLPTPVFRDQSSLIVAVDLSRSMDASDIKPTRLKRAKLKLLDLLEHRRDGQTALIVYAANAFTVTPLTSDTTTIANLVNALETSMMPAQGSEVSDALRLSDELLTQAGATEGDILLITDDFKYKDFAAIEKITNKGHRMSILGVGTPDGGPITLENGFLKDDSGHIVVPKLDVQSLQKAALKGHGLFVGMQNNDDDIEKLTTLFSRNRVEAESVDAELTADIWHEEGPWLLLVVLPLVALLSRRGVMILFVAFTLPLAEPAYAENPGSSLWLNQDQRAMKLFEQGKHGEAAGLFKQDDWRASALYRKGDYEKALELMEQSEMPPSSDSLYNRGNALARLQRYQQAIEAYDEALELNPQNEDASYNRELVMKKLQEQQQNKDQDKEQGQEDKQQQDAEQKDKKEEQKPSEKEGEKSEDEESQDGYESDKESEDDEQDKAGDKSDKEQDKQDEQEPTPESEQKEQEQASEKEQDETQNLQQKDAMEQSEEQKATEQWLKRIPDDPGGLLRRKFKYQYQNMKGQRQSPQPW